MQRPFTAPSVLLRIEGLSLLMLALAVYWALEGRWLVFALLFLVPDVSLVGYAASKRAGAAVYNLVHSTVLPAGLGAGAIVLGHRAAGIVALIWLAHIGADRMLGFGLKYPTALRDTHFRRL